MHTFEQAKRAIPKFVQEDTMRFLSTTEVYKEMVSVPLTKVDRDFILDFYTQAKKDFKIELYKNVNHNTKMKRLILPLCVEYLERLDEERVLCYRFSKYINVVSKPNLDTIKGVGFCMCVSRKPYVKVGFKEYTHDYKLKKYLIDYSDLYWINPE